jgi:hypothetical protein
MGGAFVAVANDSSATWWNPAGLAAGPFLDVALSRAITQIDGVLPADRDGGWWFSLATPPFGLSYYQSRVTGIRPIGGGAAGRQEGGDGLAVRSLSVSQFGATILHSLATGIHVGATLKYLRGTARPAFVEGVPLDGSELLDRADDLDGGEARNGFDADIGGLAVLGAVRIVREQRFDFSANSPSLSPDSSGIRLPRQVRVGAAYDAMAAGWLPLTIAVDADLRAYDTGAGERRMIAMGGEYWPVPRRVAVRGGGRVNTAGRDEAVTAGASVSPRAGMFVDAHVVHGGSAGDGGWGVAARVSF